MNIGSLYKVKKCFWLLFPTKETALALALEGHSTFPLSCPPTANTPDTATAAAFAAWYSKRYNCDVTYFPLDSYIVFLEEDGKFKKILTSEGLIGWTWFNESYNHCFEEVKTES